MLLHFLRKFKFKILTRPPHGLKLWNYVQHLYFEVFDFCKTRKKKKTPFQIKFRPAAIFRVTIRGNALKHTVL